MDEECDTCGYEECRCCNDCYCYPCECESDDEEEEVLVPPTVAEVQTVPEAPLRVPDRCCAACQAFPLTRHQPVIGSRQFDSRAVRHQGCVLAALKAHDGSQARGEISPLQLLEKPLDTTKQYFGVELETEYRYGEAPITWAGQYLYQYIWNKAIFKGDGSLNGTGIEIVSKPMELEATKKYLFTLADALTSVPLALSDRCGMHVHVSRDNLDNEVIGRMILFMHSSRDANETLITHVAGRDLSASTYAKLKPRPSSGVHRADPSGHWFQNDRYVALNCQNVHTLEFRIFAATEDPHRLCANVEFCDSVIEWCKVATDAAQVVDIAAFTSFVHSTPHKYPFLSQFLNNTESYRQREGSVAA